MRVFGLTTGADTAGINVRIAQAFARHTGWTVNAMVASQNYIGYPVDVPWNLAELERLYDSADVVHIHNTTHAHDWYDDRQGKPTVLMHHGIHEGGLAKHVASGRRINALQVGSTLDLTVQEPEIEWLPAPYNLGELRHIRAEHYVPGHVLRIAHAPTNRAIKGSGAFDDAIARLRSSGLAVEGVVIEGMSWADCLAQKATADILFDQPVLGYGCNAIEAWAMGIPVVAGVADRRVRGAMIARWGRLPFFEANEETLYDALRVLATDAMVRSHFAMVGTAHVERWHDERAVVEQLQGLYSRAPETTRNRSAMRRTREQIVIGRREANRIAAMLERRRVRLSRA